MNSAGQPSPFLSTPGYSGAIERCFAESSIAAPPRIPERALLIVLGDPTRRQGFYDPTFDYLRTIGFPML